MNDTTQQIVKNACKFVHVLCDDRLRRADLDELVACYKPGEPHEQRRAKRELAIQEPY